MVPLFDVMAALLPSQMMNTIDSNRLRPEGWGMQLVDEISFEDQHKDQDVSFVDLLSPIMHQKNEPHIIDCYEPIAVSYCEQDQQRRICQNLKDFAPRTLTKKSNNTRKNDLIPTPTKKINTRPKQLPPTPRKIKTLTKELPPTSRKIKTLKKELPPTRKKTLEKELPIYARTTQFTFKHDVWMERYKDLCVYQQAHGHCFVDWKTDPLLAQWVKRQRYQSKLKSEGKHTTITDARLMALESLGFIWETNRVTWEGRFKELSAYYQIQGHANVPSTFPENPQLAMWVKGQRRHYSLNQSGKRSSITEERTAKLDSLGFVWSVHKKTVKPR
jgi:hypothetical protein